MKLKLRGVSSRLAGRRDVDHGAFPISPASDGHLPRSHQGREDGADPVVERDVSPGGGRGAGGDGGNNPSPSRRRLRPIEEASTPQSIAPRRRDDLGEVAPTSIESVSVDGGNVAGIDGAAVRGGRAVSTESMAVVYAGGDPHGQRQGEGLNDDDTVSFQAAFDCDLSVMSGSTTGVSVATMGTMVSTKSAPPYLVAPRSRPAEPILTDGRGGKGDLGVPKQASQSPPALRQEAWQVSHGEGSAFAKVGPVQADRTGGANPAEVVAPHLQPPALSSSSSSDFDTINRARAERAAEPTRMLHKPTAEGGRRQRSGRSPGRSPPPPPQGLSETPEGEANLVHSTSSPDLGKVGAPAEDTFGPPSVKVFLLLLHPTDRIFELVQVVYRPIGTTLSDLIDLIPDSATESRLGGQRHVRLIRPRDESLDAIDVETTLASSPTRRGRVYGGGRAMGGGQMAQAVAPLSANSPAVSAFDFSTSTALPPAALHCADVVRGEILVAVPEGYDPAIVRKLSDRIFQNRKVVKLLARSDPLAPKIGRRGGSSRRSRGSSTSERSASGGGGTSRRPRPRPRRGELIMGNVAPPPRPRSTPPRMPSHSCAVVPGRATAGRAAASGDTFPRPSLSAMRRRRTPPRPSQGRRRRNQSCRKRST